MKQGQGRAVTVSTIGIFTAAAIICGYLETLIPFHIGIPGVKLGLANIMTVIVLYLFGPKEAAAVSLIRITVVSLLFGNLYSMIYSLAGGVLSFVCMILCKRVKQFGITGVSMAGGITHNIGQLFVAVLIVEELKLVYYIPVLLLSGVLTGLLIGLISGKVCDRLSPVLIKYRS